MTQNLLESIRGALVQNLPMPTGIDAGRLAVWRERGGFDYQQVRSIVGAAIQDLNEQAVTAWGDLISLTPDMKLMYMNGGAVTPAEVTSGAARPTLVRGFNAGHTIDLRVWSLGIGGTAREFEDMTEAQLVGSITALATALRDQFDYQILNRAFSNAQNLLGTSGYDVGFCDGSSSSVKYAPPKWNGQTFYEDHNHYIGINSAATNPATSANYTYADGITQLALLVAEHGIPINQDFKVYCSEADAVLIRSQKEYVMPTDDINHDRGGLTTGNIYYTTGTVGSIPLSGGRYIGAINTAYGIGRMFAVPRIPTGYAFLYRPGNAFASNNALAVRYRPSTGFGCRVLEVPDNTTTFPIKEVDVEMEFGVSCGPNRYAGACMYFNNGSTNYTAPTILL